MTVDVMPAFTPRVIKHFLRSQLKIFYPSALINWFFEVNFSLGFRMYHLITTMCLRMKLKTYPSIQSLRNGLVVGLYPLWICLTLSFVGATISLHWRPDILDLEDYSKKGNISSVEGQYTPTKTIISISILLHCIPPAIPSPTGPPASFEFVW